MGARTVDRHVDPLQQPKIHFDPERVVLLVGLPVEREQPLGAAAQKFRFAQRNMILAAGVRRPGDVTMRHQRRTVGVGPQRGQQAVLPAPEGPIR